MFRLTSTMIKNTAVDVTVHAIKAGWLRIINNKTKVKQRR